MRIIAGQAKGRTLKSVKGRGTRPTLARARAALFDMLAADVKGARFLDLFAGVGAVGLEALSRGASEAVFVESSAKACNAIRSNLRVLGLEDRGRVICSTVEQALSMLQRRGQVFDFVFLDPPYAQVNAAQRALESIGAGILAEGGSAIWQHSARTAPPPRLGLLRRARSRRAGDTCLTFYESTAEGCEE